MSKQTDWLKTTVLAALLAVSPLTLAQGVNTVDESPSALAMTGDLLLVRPLMLATTAVGSAVWLVSLPFSLAAGNAMQAADTLVVSPGANTFFRCLGCTRTGYRVDSE